MHNILYTHAVPCCQVSMNESLLREIFHSQGNLMTHSQQQLPDSLCLCVCSMRMDFKMEDFGPKAIIDLSIQLYMYNCNSTLHFNWTTNSDWTVYTSIALPCMHA